MIFSERLAYLLLIGTSHLADFAAMTRAKREAQLSQAVDEFVEDNPRQVCVVFFFCELSADDEAKLSSLCIDDDKMFLILSPIVLGFSNARFDTCG